MVLLERILQEEYTFVNITIHDAIYCTVLYVLFERVCVCEIFTKK
jgi:hypothetical protein